MEVLVGKIFDLAFMPAMNGERVPVPPWGHVAWGHSGYWFVGPV